MYTQVMYCLERVPMLANQKPQLREHEPFKTILSSGNRQAIARLPLVQLEAVLFATLASMTVDQFNAEAKAWLMAVSGPIVRQRRRNL
jgi:hypothetical protein